MKHRHIALVALGTLSLTAQCWAADPIVGAWKLNVAKSKFPSPQAALKEQTEVYREVDGGQMELTFRQTAGDGSSQLARFTWPLEGGAVKIHEGKYPEGSSFVETIVGPGEWYVTYMLNGRQLATMHKLISKDTIHEIIRSADPQGKPIEYFLVLDRK